MIVDEAEQHVRDPVLRGRDQEPRTELCHEKLHRPHGDRAVTGREPTRDRVDSLVMATTVVEREHRGSPGAAPAGGAVHPASARDTARQASQAISECSLEISLALARAITTRKPRASGYPLTLKRRAEGLPHTSETELKNVEKGIPVPDPEGGEIHRCRDEPADRSSKDGCTDCWS